MRTFLSALVALAALAVAGAASAGGWATVGISPQPPDTAKTPWNVDVRVLRHGRTPVDTARPTITIRNESTGRTLTFRAVAAGKAGMYRARVVFPSPGRWSYEVDNGLAATGYGSSQTQTYKPVDVGPAPETARRLPIALVAAGAAVLALLLALVVRRRPRARLAPTTS